MFLIVYFWRWCNKIKFWKSRLWWFFCRYNLKKVRVARVWHLLSWPGVEALQNVFFPECKISFQSGSSKYCVFGKCEINVSVNMLQQCNGIVSNWIIFTGVPDDDSDSEYISSSDDSDSEYIPASSNDDESGCDLFPMLSDIQCK